MSYDFKNTLQSLSSYHFVSSITQKLLAVYTTILLIEQVTPLTKEKSVLGFRVAQEISLESYGRRNYHSL